MDALDVARFWSSVKVGKYTECWPWLKRRRDYGYGEFKADRTKSAHRVAYEIVTGQPIAPDTVIRHKCDNPACCNPLHLETGTHTDNVLDRVIRGRGAIGTKNSKAKLTDDQVRQLRAVSRELAYAMGKTLGVSHDTVYKIRRGDIWKHLLVRDKPTHS